ncbi:hypothetical protein AAKU67_000728 [Oxalobacteraceae bacterium GrIS 2.11]
MSLSFRLLATPLLLAALNSFAAADTVEDKTPGAPHEIKDPYYGETLFQFFQDHYFSTLTGLMVSQHFERIGHHAEEAEVLRGGILLSYGMHREAGDVFERLIDIGAAPATRDRAWFYLAKIRYQRGYLPEAEAALKHIGNDLPPDLQEERGLLQANVLMARSDYAAALEILQPMEATALDPTYVRYNLGIALMKTGSSERGIAMLDQVGIAPAEDEEHRALRDRANLALGFSALADNNNLQARSYFERIRLKSAQANKALLGMGWSSVSDKEFKQALVPWMELAQRDDNDTAELEAKLAVPYAYAELGALGQSAKLYNDAITDFSKEDTDLNESISAIKSGKLVDALISENPGEEMGWFWSIKSLPTMPHSAHLAHVLAQHEFQEAFKNYRDLQFLSKNLTDWRDKLNVFADMLENRRKAFAERLPQVMQESQSIGINAMRERQTQLTRQVASAAADGDGIAFADAKQTAVLARVNEAQQLIDRHPGEAEFTAASDKVRLAHGALTWQLAQDYTERSYRAQQEVQTISAQIGRAQQLEAELLQAQRDEPLHFDQFEQRLNAISAALNNTIPRIAALSQEQQQAVQDIAIAQLSHERTLLVQYTTQAKFALAQLYDRGTGHTTPNTTLKTEADHATP